MSNFFDSEIIQDALKEINELQQDVYSNLIGFQNMTRQEKLEHVETLLLLLEKQKIMYTRLSLSDDPDATRMLEELKKSISGLGFGDNADINTLFTQMNSTIEKLKQSIDA